MKRKLFSLLLAVFTVLATVPISVFANSSDVGVNLDDMYTMQIAVDSVTADLGSDTVKVNISVAKNGGFAGVIYQLMYDNSVLTLESAPTVGTLSDFELVSGPVEASSHIAILTSSTNVFGDGTLVTYTFKVNPEADAGTYDITLLTSGQTSGGIALGILDENRDTVSHTVINGGVTIPGFTVAYDANGGTGAPSGVVKTNGRDVTISALTPIRSGYNFLGWATSADATSAEYKPGDVYSQNADVTLYAVWEKIIINPGTLMLEVETVDGAIGEEVEVDINITNNPGVGSMAFDLVYDSEVLEIKGWSDKAIDDSGEEIRYPGSGNWTVSPLDRYENRVNFRFFTYFQNIEQEDTILTLTFLVKDTAPEGVSVIRIVPEDGNFYQYVGDEKVDVDIEVAVENGGINAVSGELLGDINLDEVVDMNDAILLLQYSMFPELYPIGYKGSVDFTKDGNVDMNDAILLLQYSMFPDLYPIA